MNTLTIDIGNTTIAFGLFCGKRLVLSFKLATHNKSRDFYRKSIKRALNKKDIGKIIICSVVPQKTRILKGVLKEIFKIKVLEAGRDIKIPIKNLYKNPKQVGQDRLVNAFAGLKLFGKGLILVDFGTAITFDIVSKNGEYLGGLILPGLDLCCEILNLRTALLPKIKIEKLKVLIGRDTKNSINSGIVFGISGACDKIIERLEKKFRGYKIIATGGNAKFIKQYSSKIKIVRPHLTLEGLNLLS